MADNSAPILQSGFESRCSADTDDGALGVCRGAVVAHRWPARCVESTGRVEAQLIGVAGLEFEVGDGDQDQLNPLGVNCLRKLPSFGAVIWGARTLATNAESCTPELVHPVLLNRVVVEQQTLLAIVSFILIYAAVFVLGTAVLALDAAFGGPRFDVLDLVFASASTLGNAGVGLGPAGTTGSFAAFGDSSTIAMTLLMWVGRLEILPVVVLLRRSYWRL